MRVRLETTPIGCLQLTQFRRLGFMRVDREALVDEEVPDFFPALARVKSFVLRIAHPAELLVGTRRFGPVTLADELNDAFAVIDLLAQESTQVSAFRAENLLPGRLITEKSQRISHQLPGAS